MATVPRRVLEYVSWQVNALSADAKARVLRVLESIEWTPDNVAQCREAVVQVLAAAMPTYTDAAAQAGADLYDAVREAAVGEAMGAAAISGYEPDATEGAVRAFVQDIVDGGPVELFNRKVLDRVDYEIRRSENASVAANAALDPLEPRFARVPTGAETCEFCLMLASRGFAYTSAASAGRGDPDHYHPNCDCRVVQGYDGMDVEGYDPEAYGELWDRSRELRESGVPAAQREAVLAAMRDRLIPHYSAPAADLAGLYQRGIDSAWREFKRAGKTRDGYDSTMGAFLADIGDACGADLSAEFMARPDGNELWAAARLARRYRSIRFRYAASDTKNPDFLLDGELAELKTPESMKKVRRRTKGIPEQFAPYPDEPVFGVVSTLYSGEPLEVLRRVRPFVEDGTLDKAVVITTSGLIDA